MKQIKIPKTVSQHRQAWLWKPIYRRLHKYNKMYSGVFVGEPGSGKSYCALSLADLLDCGESGESRFSIDRVCFSASQFANLVSKKLPKGSAIIIDDAGLSLYSREAMTKIVRQISKIFQSMRYKNLLIFLTLPSLGSLDKGVRELVNGYFEPLDIDFEIEKVKCKYHRLQVNPKTGKMYYHRPSKIVRGFYNDGYPKTSEQVIDSIWIDKPPVDLIEKYELAKKTYLDDWNLRNLKTIRAEENMKKMPKVNTFKKYLDIVNADRVKYSGISKGIKGIELTKIMKYHPECTAYTARLVCRYINKEKVFV